MAARTRPPAAETAICTPPSHSSQPSLRLLHFNDIYHIHPGTQDPIGGFARFSTLVNYYQSSPRFAHLPEALTLFSGDAFNPSLESSVTKGAHMVPVLNHLNTAAACLGNHDLDFGVQQFAKLRQTCTFPWLCANVLDPALGEGVPLGGCKRGVMLTASNGIKVGVMGLVEREWLDTINALPPDLIFLETADVAQQLAQELRAQGAEMVIALTHQREPNDLTLARALEPGTLDLILGGHDHFYAHAVINGIHIPRSVTDFKQLSYLEAFRRVSPTPSGDPCWDFSITRLDIVVSVPEDPAALAIVGDISATLTSKMDRPIGRSLVPLDARFTTVRQGESNMGNFVTDLLRAHYTADVCIIAAGTIRGDQIYPPGVLRVRDIMTCFPFEDPCVVVSVTGEALVKALENGVSKYPALEGRFPQVSGLSFAFDPAKAAGGRVSGVTLGGLPLELLREYTVATRDYMARGRDGYTALMTREHGGTTRTVFGEEGCMLLSTMLRQYLMSLKVLGKWAGDQAMGRHW